MSRVLVSVTATLMMGNFPWRIERFPQIWDQFYLVERQSEKERLLIISARLVVGIDIKAEAVVNLLPCYKSSGSKMEIQRLKVLIEGPFLKVLAVERELKFIIPA